MKKKNKKEKLGGLTQLDLIKGHRKKMPKPTVIFKSKKDKKYNWNWQEELDDYEDIIIPWENKNE